MNRSRHRGAVLLLAMIFLLLLAIVAGTVMQTSVLEFQMAGNDQFREDAFQRAQAIISELSEDLDNFPVVGAVGYTVCVAADAGTGDCNNDGNNLIDPNSAVVSTGVDLDFQVVRQGPLFYENLPFRLSQSEASSSPNFDAALFEVNVDVDGNAVRLGSSQVVQGVAVRVAASSQ